MNLRWQARPPCTSARSKRTRRAAQDDLGPDQVVHRSVGPFVDPLPIGDASRSAAPNDRRLPPYKGRLLRSCSGHLSAMRRRSALTNWLSRPAGGRQSHRASKSETRCSRDGVYRCHQSQQRSDGRAGDVFDRARRSGSVLRIRGSVSSRSPLLDDIRRGWCSLGQVAQEQRVT